jgi:hypothetical protein
MSRTEKLLILRSFKEWIQGSMNVDTMIELQEFGYDPEFMEILFDSGWTGARVVRTNCKGE